MKQSLILLACLLSLASCQRDPYPLELGRFEVNWYDLDLSNTQSLADEFRFNILVNITDPEADEQFITQWEFAYFVNGAFAGVLLSDYDANANSITANLDITPKYLKGPEPLQPGDVLEFRLWAIDNHGTELEEFHTVTLQH